MCWFSGGHVCVKMNQERLFVTTMVLKHANTKRKLGNPHAERELVSGHISETDRLDFTSLCLVQNRQITTDEIFFRIKEVRANADDVSEEDRKVLSVTC